MSIHRVAGCGVPLLLFVLSVFSIGCTGGQRDGYSGPRGQVAGRVTVDGQPLTKGWQVFFQADKVGYYGVGVVGDDGQYKVEYSRGSGLPTGDYSVQISPPPVMNPTPPTGPPDDPKVMELERKYVLDAMSKPSKGGGLFPAKYGSINTSGLKFRVEANQNTANFDLAK